MLIPVYDAAVHTRSTPAVIGLVVVSTLAFAGVWMWNGLYHAGAVVPSDLMALVDGGGATPGWRVVLTLVTATFVHASIAHITVNMLVLWVLGRSVEVLFTQLLRAPEEPVEAESKGEESKNGGSSAGVIGLRGWWKATWGPAAFVALYLAGGSAGALAQVVADPASTTPIVGASGAVSCVLGTYLVLLPRNRAFVVMGAAMMFVPAWLAVVFWAAFELIMMLVGTAGEGTTIAYASHLGGLFFGATLAFPLRRQARRRAPSGRLTAGGAPDTPVPLEEGDEEAVARLNRSAETPRVVAGYAQALIVLWYVILCVCSVAIARDVGAAVGAPGVAVVPVWLFLIPTLLYPAQVATVRRALAERGLRLPASLLFPSFSARRAAVALAPCIGWAAIVAGSDPLASSSLLWLAAPLYFAGAYLLLDPLAGTAQPRSHSPR